MKTMGEIARMVEIKMILGMTFCEAVESTLINPTAIDYGMIKHIIATEAL